MGIKERLFNTLFPRLFPKEISELNTAYERIETAMRTGAFVNDPQRVLAALREDSRLLDLIVRTRGTAAFGGHQYTGADRQRVIEQARRMRIDNVSISQAAKIWTDFGTGQTVAVSASEAAAETALSEFWGAIRNEPILGVRNIAEISFDALDEGEIAFVFWYSPLDGESYLRTLPTDSLELITLPNDPTTTVFYKYTNTNSETVYFPDWKATPEQLAEIKLPDDALRFDIGVGGEIELGGEQQRVTRAVVLHVARNTVKVKSESGELVRRGLPQFSNALEWAKVLTQFMGDRAAVARKAAMFTETVTVSGGSRAVADITSQLQSGLVTGSDYSDTNPPPAAASDWIQNDEVKRDWQQRDTGASSARYDGRMLAGQMTQGTGIPLHLSGFPDALANRSTAEELKIPFFEQIKRYRVWFRSVWEDVCVVVLMLLEKHGTLKIGTGNEITVDLDVPVGLTVDEILAIFNSLEKAAKDGVIDNVVAQGIMAELLALLANRAGIKYDNAMSEKLQGVPIGAELGRALVENLAGGKITADELAEFVVAIIEQSDL